MTLPLVTVPDTSLTDDSRCPLDDLVLFWVGRTASEAKPDVSPSQRFPQLTGNGYQVVNLNWDNLKLEKCPTDQPCVLLIDDTVELQPEMLQERSLTIASLQPLLLSSNPLPVVLWGVATDAQVAALIQKGLPPGVYTVVSLQSAEGLLHQLALAFQVAKLRSQNHKLATQVQNLDRLNLLKDEFIGTVVHELRTPITNMKVAGQLVEAQIQRVQQALGEEIQSDSFGKALIYLQTLKQECERETVLINNLLDLQSLESGSYPLDYQPIQVESWLADLIEPFRHRVQTRQLNLELRILDIIPPLVSSAMSLERVLNELLHNACKYTPPGETIQLLAALNSPETLELTVRNTGVEIPPAERSRVFEKFYRVPSSDRWKQGGTGLGLALVKQLMNNLGGNIELDCGAGATQFILHLPLGYPAASV